MHIGSADIEPLEVVAQFLGHAFGQRGHQGAFATLDAQLYLLNEVIDLSLRRTHDDLRVEQAGGADELFGDDTLALVEFVIGGCGAHVDGLMGQFLKFLKPQGPVIQCSLQTEAVVHQIGLARLVSAIHGADLRHSHVALVDNGEEIVGEVVQQAEWTHAGPTSVKIS